jgi:outer membrane receptor protein involved in Fe transport
MKGDPVRKLLLACLLLAPLPALADTHVFDYDYLEVGHARSQPDGGASGSGTYADLSYSFLDDVQLRASYGTLSFPAAVGYKDYSIGISGESAINAQTDVYTDLLYINDRYDRLHRSVTDDGYRLAVGIRHHPHKLDWLELDGWLAHNWLSAVTDLEHDPQQAYLPQSSSEIGAGVLFQPIHWLSFGLSYAHAFNSGNTTSLRVRFYFGGLDL